jgi:hypothetical protein
MITSTPLTTTTANILAGTSTVTRGVTAMYLCNTTGSAVTANVFLVPAGGTPEASPIYNNLTIAANDTHLSDLERIVLDNGDSIWANCSVNNAVVFTISSTGA